MDSEQRRQQEAEAVDRLERYKHLQAEYKRLMLAGERLPDWETYLASRERQ